MDHRVVVAGRRAHLAGTALALPSPATLLVSSDPDRRGIGLDLASLVLGADEAVVVLLAAAIRSRRACTS